MKLDVSGSNHIEFKRGAVRNVYRAATGQFVISVIIGDDGLPYVSSVTVGDLEARDKRGNDMLSAGHIHLELTVYFLGTDQRDTHFDFSADIQDLFLPQASASHWAVKLRASM